MPKSRKRHQKRTRGGSAPSPSSYSSASTYGSTVNGSGMDQFNRVFNNGTQSNVSIGAQGQNSGVSSKPNTQDGGRRYSRRRSSKRKTRAKRGGFMGVLNQAIIPLSIFGMQQRYKRKTKKHKR